MRASGILMHISSLPSEYGIGTFGREARRFVDFFGKGGAVLLADSSDMPDKLWRFSISVIFKFCGQSLFY